MKEKQRRKTRDYLACKPNSRSFYFTSGFICHWWQER